MKSPSKVTLKDIARRAGCGVGTVSDIVNRNKLEEYSAKNIERIRSLAAEMGYVTNRQASSLRTGKTRTIGVTHGFMTKLQAGFNIPYSNQIYQGLGSVLDAHNYNLLFQNVRHMADTVDAGPTEMARSGEVDALVYIYFSAYRDQFEKRHTPGLKQAEIPVVVVHTTDKYFPFPGVGLDVEAGAMLAVGHLVEHGYASVGFVGHLSTGELHDAFYRGYVRALERAGMPLDRNHVIDSPGTSTDAGETVADTLLRQGTARPRAVFVTEDATAYGMLKKFRRSGVSVPDDIAVMGFGGNFNDQQIWTALSSLVQPGLTKGRTAGELLLKHLGDPAFRDMPDSVILEPKLDLRESCGC